MVGQVSSVKRGRALVYDPNFDGNPPTKVPFDDVGDRRRAAVEVHGHAHGWQAMGPMVVSCPEATSSSGRLRVFRGQCPLPHFER